MLRRIWERPSMRYPLVVGAAIGLLGVGFEIGEHFCLSPAAKVSKERSGRVPTPIEKRLGMAITTWSGVESTISCENRWAERTGNDGTAITSRHLVILDSARVCDVIANSSEKQYQTDKLARAVQVVTHESWHLRNPNGSESTTECYAIQSIAAVTEMLGNYSRDTAVQLAATEVFTTPAEGYGPETECRPGGSLDLHIAERGQVGFFREGSHYHIPR